ncbi:Arylsulphatase [Thozetella sp. PMI_491]|nr:Arylsulphatase [Thozetella sp. PMI_491]
MTIKPRRLALFLWCFAAPLIAFLVYTVVVPESPPSASLPNIVFILTDDQDVHMNSLEYMPYLKAHITDRGTLFRRHYCTVALCCPSRVNLWTGKAAHNTNVTDLAPPFGGYPKFVEQGFNNDYLPIWLQAAGYNTYYVGKLFNSHTVSNYDNPHAGGWTGSDFLLDPYTYEYWNATMQRNHDSPESYEGQYSTDVIAEKAFGFLQDALIDDKPFFLTIAPTAPHSNVANYQQSPPRPAERHKDLFRDAVVPRNPNFNPEIASGVSWISRLPRQTQEIVDYNDDWYRNRLRTLQAVDEMVDGLVKRLEDAGILDRTYLVYSTDNGYSIGQHRRQPGKQCAFEDDINVPLIVRGPGVPEGHISDAVSSHTDLAPTFLNLAGVDEVELKKYRLDGAAITLAPSTSSSSQEHVNVEMWGIILSEGKYGYVLYNNHTYKALRVIGDGYSLLYTIWCTGEHELYDLVQDPWEMNNLFNANSEEAFSIFPAGISTASRPNFDRAAEQAPISSYTHTQTTISRLIPRLDALLIVLKTCQEDQCRWPWETLHPGGGVQSLSDALASHYDAFYSTRPKVAYDACERGYIKSSEGVMWDGRLDFDNWLRD